MFKYLNTCDVTVNIQKRLKVNNNSTHDSFADQQIKKATLWKIHSHKQICAVIIYILTFGVVFLITRISTKLYLVLLCVPSTIKDAQYILITDIHNINYLIPLAIETFPSHELKKIKSTLYHHRYITKSNVTSNPIYNNTSKCFYFLNNKYKYDNTNHLFIPVSFYLNHYTLHELSQFKHGLPSINVLTYLQHIHLANETHLKQYTFLKLMILECSNWAYLYNLISIIIWLIDLWYWQFAIVISALSLFLIITASLRKRDTLSHVCNSHSTNTHIKVKRPFHSSINDDKDEDGFIYTTSTNIYPGDVIKIEKTTSNTHTPLSIPCDGLILEGYCTINESDLTGENTLVLKKEINFDNDSEMYFNYNNHLSNIVYQGSSISTLYLPRNKKEQLVLLVIDTGYNTYRGNMVTNWEKHIPNNNINRFNKDIILLGCAFGSIWLFTSIFVFCFYNTYYDVSTSSINPTSYSKRLLLCLDNITVVLPPGMAICINFCRLFFNFKLKHIGIRCIVEKKVEEAGRVDVIVFDKTGTLTESKFGIHCYKVNQLSNKGVLCLGKEEFHPDTLNKIYKCVQHKIFNLKVKSLLQNKYTFNTSYQTSLMYNIIYFTECVACCHNVFPINNHVFGNALDMELFKDMKWELTQENENINSDVYIHPRYSLQIVNLNKENNEMLYKERNKRKSNNNSHKWNVNMNYYLKYIERFEFMAQLQCISVLVENAVDGSVRAFAKGAPEKIRNVCLNETLPVDLDMQLEYYTSKGFRVLACATKLIMNYNKRMLIRDDIENDMCFLGLIIFKNQIKRNTTMNINKLKTAKCRIVVATGDNVYTTLNVAKQCGIIEHNEKIVHIEHSKKHDGYLVLKYDPTELNNDNDNNTININSTNHNNNNVNDDNNTEHIVVKSNIPFINIEDKDESYMYNDNVSNSVNNNNNTMSICNYNDNNITVSEKDNLAEFTAHLYKILSVRTSIICISGNTFNLILNRMHNKRTQYNHISLRIITDILSKKGKIYYRMLPEHKSSLVSFLQSYNNNIVAMCGDGANDCRAFMTADIGIAINQSTNTTLISHFYTSKDSISCVITIISNGRACFENKIISIKFMILYSLIQITSVLFLNIESQSMNNHQYLFTDLFFILIPMIIAVSTMASKSIAKIKPPKIIVDGYFVYSVLGQIALQIGSHVMYGMFIRKRTIHPVLDVKPRNDLNVLSTYMYVFALFQYLNVLFIFNSNSIYRKQFYTNKLYLVYYGCCVMISVCFVAVKEMPRKISRLKLVMFEDDSVNFEYRLEINKAITILWIFIWFIVCILYENVLFKKCVLRYNKSKPTTDKSNNSNSNNPVQANKST